jgi:tetratricopeptide (TPR) repeat protein
VAAAVERRLGAAPELVPLLSLVRAVVPVDLPESDLTRQMAGPVRADNTNRLLLHLLGEAARSQPLLLLLEDGHWMDSASWHLTLQIARSQPRVLVVLSTRPLEKPPTEHGKLLELPEATRIELASLDSEELMALVARRLGVDALPDALSRLLEERCEGNPFYAEELALSLRDAGLVVVEDGRCRLVSETALSELNVPATLQGVITGRVDRLPPPSQLTLKVASVIGRLFETPMLCGVHPIPADVETVPQQLEGLAAAELIAPEPTPLVPAHGFRHAVIHESVYGLLPYAQRRTLHRAVALHLEEVHRHDRATIHPLLAHHYDAAEMPDEAVASLRAAGEQALDASANQEAVRLLARALALDAGRQNGLSPIERIELQRSLGMAHFGLTQYDGQRAAYESVLRGAGIRIPRGDWRILQELGVLLRQALRERVTGRRAPRLAGDAHEACVLAMRAQGDMLTALSFEGRRFEAVEVALQMFNLGGRIDPTPEASAARVGYGLFLAMAGLRGIGERQIRRGLDECLAAGHLLYTVQAFTILGQVLVMRGRCREGCRCLREAVARADALGTKLWHQRSSYALGDALSATGEFEESRASLVRAGALSLDTEPQTVGLMRSLQGLCMLRLGRDDEALALLEEGVAASRDHPAALPIFASLGALAEARLRCGSLEPALDAAREAEEISRRSNEVSAYRPGIHGFWGICQVYLALWRRAESGEAGVTPQAAGEARLRAERAVRAFRGFVRVFPSARPRWQLAEGLRQLQRGRTRRALRWFRRAARGAGSSEQPYEQGLAYFYLAQHGSRRERPWAAERAREVLERAHLAHELRELRAFGGSVAVT